MDAMDAPGRSMGVLTVPRVVPSPSRSSPAEDEQRRACADAHGAGVGASSVESRAPHPVDRPASLAMQRFIVGQIQDEEEAAEVAERQAALPIGRGSIGAPATSQVAGDGSPGVRSADEHGVGAAAALCASMPSAAAGSGAVSRRVLIEPAFKFVGVPTADELKDVTDVFVSPFMMDVTSEWPQPSTSRLRKHQNALGKESRGARKGATRGSNATTKTWSSRIRTACAFANFVGRSVCIDRAKPRPDDAEIDRGVRKFFRCLTPYTKIVITTFLECRRRGYAVAGGGRPLSATSLKDYSSGLTYLFAEGKVDGVRGVCPVVPDCCERSSPWQPKGVAELREEEKVRADPGTYTGNPMATADLRDFRGATNKEARHGGETQLSSAPVTNTMMERWFGTMIQQYQRTTDEAGKSISLVASLSAMVTSSVSGATSAAAMQPDKEIAEKEGSSPPADEAADDEPRSCDEDHTPAFTPPSNALADFLVYVFYVFAFVTIARPITLINMKFKDVNWPDLDVAENQQFFNLHRHHRYIELKLRITKTGNDTSDVMTLRIFSFYASPTQVEKADTNVNAYIHCPCEHLNIPQLMQPLVLFACSAPGVGMDMGSLAEQPLFPSLSVRNVAGTVTFFKMKSETEVNAQFAADLARIGRDLVNGERAVRMYGFRRGGAQALLDRTGLYEQVMRLGGWQTNSNSFFKYITQMNAKGTLRSTLRSFTQDEVVQVVGQLMCSYNEWAVGVVRRLCTQAEVEEGQMVHSSVVAFEAENVKVLCSIVSECVLVLRHGKSNEAVSSDDE